MRVIHRETEEKALLRGHALEDVDLKFLPGQDVIATVANDGNVYVWRLSCVGSEIKSEPVLQATWGERPPQGGCRLARHVSTARSERV